MKHILETTRAQKRCRLLAANTASTKHCDIFRLLIGGNIRKVVFYPGWKIPKRCGLRIDSVFKRANRNLVAIARINDQRVGLAYQGVPCIWRNISANAILGVDVSLPHGHDFLLQPYFHAIKGRRIAQFFFDINSYFDFLDGAIKRGISIPIIPGILPVTNCKRTMEFAKKMNCKVPRSLVEMFKGLDSDIETRKLVATTIVYDQCMKLISSGIKDFHFYTLNRADLSFAICHILGIRILKDDT